MNLDSILRFRHVYHQKNTQKTEYVFVLFLLINKLFYIRHNISRLQTNTGPVLTKASNFLSKQKINRIFQDSVLYKNFPVY